MTNAIGQVGEVNPSRTPGLNPGSQRSMNGNPGPLLIQWRHYNSLLGFPRRVDGRYGFEKYFKLYYVLHSSSNENWFAHSTNTV